MKDIVKEKMLLSRCLGFLFLLFNDFNAINKVDGSPNSMHMTPKQLLKLSNQLVDAQFSEITNFIGKMEDDPQTGYFVHLLLATAYLNKYQIEMPNKTVNGKENSSESPCS